MSSVTLLEFRAGRMRVETDAATKKASLVADEQRGAVRLTFDQGDDILRFEWRALATPSDADEFILFDDDASFDKLKQAPPGARVYSLRFASTGKRVMYYLQRRQDAAADALLCERVQRIIADPRGALAAVRARTADFQLSADDLLMDEDEPPVSSATAPAPASLTAPAAAAAPPSAASAMQSILSNLFAAGGPASLAARSREPLELTAVLTSDIVGPHLADPALAPLLAELYDLMPAGSGRSVHDLVDLLRSPQFKQGLGQLDAALQGGELASILMQVGVPMPSDAELASDEPALVFLRAFVAKHRKP